MNENNPPRIHPLADVQSAQIGPNTQVWQFAIVLPQARIGADCNINCHTFIENDVILGDRVTVKSGVYLWDGLRAGNDVFIGPNVSFTNDPLPRSRQHPEKFQQTIIEDGASIGANAVILGGVRIGRYALIGAGSVVTKDVPAYALVYGQPARQNAWVDEQGAKLIQKDELTWISPSGAQFVLNPQTRELDHA